MSSQRHRKIASVSSAITASHFVSYLFMVGEYTLSVLMIEITCTFTDTMLPFSLARISESGSGSFVSAIAFQGNGTLLPSISLEYLFIMYSFVSGAYFLFCGDKPTRHAHFFDACFVFTSSHFYSNSSEFRGIFLNFKREISSSIFCHMDFRYIVNIAIDFLHWIPLGLPAIHGCHCFFSC